MGLFAASLIGKPTKSAAAISAASSVQLGRTAASTHTNANHPDH